MRRGIGDRRPTALHRVAVTAAAGSRKVERTPLRPRAPAPPRPRAHLGSVGADEHAARPHAIRLAPARP